MAATTMIIVLSLIGFYMSSSSAETAQCLMIYDEGGAMAVVQSRDCPRWGPSISWDPVPDPNVLNCSEAMFHTLRGYFGHHHIFCDVDATLAYHGLDDIQKEANIGIIAVFDGHEDSEMAWKYLEEYFFLHAHFLFNGTYYGRLEGMLTDNFDGSFHATILKEALLRAIRDIDISLSKNGYTMTIILMVDDQIFITSFNGRDERILETAAGSYNGSLAASQSVCDVSSSRLDDMKEHLLLYSNDSYLEATASMKLKRLMSQGLCDAMRDTYLVERSRRFSSCVYLFKDIEGCKDKLASVPVHDDRWGIKNLFHKGSGLTLLWFEKLKKMIGFALYT